MARTVLQDVDRVLASSWYRAWALVHKTDDNKIKLERQGQRRPISGDSWARTFIEAIRVGLAVQPPPPPPDPPPPPPPPPTFVKVAPITVREEGGSDQRVCLFTGEIEGGPLRPGVVKLPDGRYTDESGAIYQSNGLEDTGIRSKATDTRLVSARQMDGRNACQCPPVGDPTTNTGSWAI